MVAEKGDCSQLKEYNLKEIKGPKFGVRHQQCILVFFGIGVIYSLQTNLSFAIVAMTNKQSANPDFEEFDWDEKTKSLLLSSFFWGYMLTQISLGRLAQRFGAKLPLLVAVLAAAILNLITPITTSLGGYKVLMALRIIQGLFQGGLFPCIHTLLSKWAPIDERAGLSIMCYSGSQCGTVIVLATAGLIASSPLGWPSLFYIWGILGLMWCIAWYIFGSSSPAEHNKITAEEKSLIERRPEQDVEDCHESNYPIPWSKMFTSVPFYALLVVHCAHGWCFWILISITPIYLNGYLGMDLSSNGLVSALPSVGMLLFSFIFYFLNNYARDKGVSLAFSRKLFNSIGMMVPGLALIGLGYVSRDTIPLAIILLVTAVGVNAGVYFGYHVNHIDLSPNFAGIMMGVTNALATAVGIVAILVVGFVVSDETDPIQWRIVFFISAIVYFIGNFAFVLFGKMETQPWDRPVTKS